SFRLSLSLGRNDVCAGRGGVGVGFDPDILSSSDGCDDTTRLRATRRLAFFHFCELRGRGSFAGGCSGRCHADARAAFIAGRRAATMDIDGHLAITSNREILRDIASKQGPKRSLIAFGYAGWAPGQLEGELARRFWFTAAQDANLVFEADRDKVWEDAVARRT